MHWNRTLAGMACVVTLSFVSAPGAHGQGISSLRVATGLNKPIWCGSPPGDMQRLFIAEQDGRIQILANGSVLATPFLDISTKVASGGERGLLGVAFHPDYASNGYFFVHYTKSGTSFGDSMVERYQVSGNPDVADASTAVVFLGPVDQPFSNHNSGMISFGPNDGRLYVSYGDGGNSGDPQCNAQNMQTRLGKMLRLDVDTNPNGPAIAAAGNPFVNDVNVLNEIWASGLRNPWRWSFDRATGDLWIADVGQFAREEINFVPASSTGGENYGWKVMEGFSCFSTAACPPVPLCNDPSYVDPVLDYGHNVGDSVVGGYVYRGCAIPALRGTYFYSDNGSSRIWSFELDQNDAVINFVERTAALDPPPFNGNINEVSSFGEDGCGELYICDRIDGEVFKIVPRALCQADLGFQGHGSARLSVCGGDLSTGTTSDMIVCPLVPGSAMLLLGSFSNVPTQVWEVKSQLVPIPPIFAIPVIAPGGDLVIPINGGGGPGSLYVQWVIQEAGTPTPSGYYATNAVRLDFLP